MNYKQYISEFLFFFLNEISKTKLKNQNPIRGTKIHNINNTFRKKNFKNQNSKIYLKKQKSRNIF